MTGKIKQKPPPTQIGEGNASLSVGLGGVGSDAGSRLDTTQGFLTEDAVTNKVLPTNRAETLEDVGHRAVHNRRLLTVLTAERDALGECLTAHDEGAVHIDGAGRTRVVRCVGEQRRTGRLDEADSFELANLTGVHSGCVGVLVRVTPCGCVGGRTEVVGHIRVHEADVLAVERGDVRSTQLCDNTADIVGGEGVVAVDGRAACRVGCATGCVDHIVTSGNNVTANGVDGDTGVVANNVGGNGVHGEERGGSQLGRGDRCVAVLVQGDGHLAVAHGDRGDIFTFTEGGGGGRQVCELREGHRCAGVGGVGGTNVCEAVVVEFGAEGEVRQTLEGGLVNREVASLGHS